MRTLVLLGLLLIVVAAAALVEISMNDSVTTTSINLLDWTFTLSSFELFLTGAATAAVLFIGLFMVTGGMRRSAAKRRKMRDSRLAERDRVAQLESEKRDLERRLENTPEPAPVADPVDHDADDTRAPLVRNSSRDADHDGVPDRDERDLDDTHPNATDQLVAGGRRSTTDDRL